MADLKRESRTACTDALRPYGFVAKRTGPYLQPLAKDPAVFGWLGLNLAAYELPAKLYVNPVVGVRYVALEKALVELAGWGAPVAVVSRPLGYLRPENTFRQWEFVSGRDLTAVADDLAHSVATYGQPFIDKWSDPQVLSADLESSGLLLAVQKFLVQPVVEAVYGRPDVGERMVLEELDRVRDKPDAYSQAFARFAAKFAEYDFNSLR